MMKNKNVVTIGGGTGSYVLLSGLKKYPVKISAIVTMADSGGSTGILRDELGVLPPGDIRQCIIALSESSDIMRELMGYRFNNGTLKGHNFGNIFLSALEKVTGKFSLGVEEASDVLKVKGMVIPVSDEQMHLRIKLRNGQILKGENELDYNPDIHKYGIEKVYLLSKVKPYQKAIDSIKNADYIILGPGDHYGSIIPNLLINGICDAIKKSKAKVIYNCNLTNKRGQTDNYDLDRYVCEIEKFIGQKRIDYVTYNTKTPSKKMITMYEEQEGAGAVVVLNKPKKKRTFKIKESNLLNEKLIKAKKNDNTKRSFIRHDSEKLAKTVMQIMGSR